ncbi:Uncharacterised protein [Serratia fonticola]|uniref:Uncharacterized protein n=1 Tax=Serratia fonticola TaxID=47917 RepID=A0A4U9VZD2_SERFO|nr:Uncharacterised protein [Serratia fonticola]VTR51799.1 Uncharacterised protein [Serratia fonticola]
MTNKAGKHMPRGWGAGDLKYYGTLCGLALMAPLTLGMMLWLLPAAQAAADNADVEGANGSLYVHGALTESACRLAELIAGRYRAVMDFHLSYD